MRTTALALAICIATPAVAERRKLDVPADKTWMHAATGLMLRPVIADLQRTQIIDLEGAENDISAQFQAADGSTFLNVYIFHSPLPSAAVWFDRASLAIEKREVYGAAQPVELPAAVTRPHATAASGLKRQYVPGKGPLRSTGLAMFPLNDWLVAVRLSSEALDSAELSARLEKVIAQVGWPDKVDQTPTAKPIVACATPLKVSRAKLQKGDLTQAILAGAMATSANGAGKDKKKEDSTTNPSPPAQPQEWCRDGAGTVDFSVYRPTGSDNGYTLAIGDAGRIAVVEPNLLAALIGGRKGYSVSFHDVDGSVSSYPSFDRLPEPQQVITLIRTEQPIARTTGDNIAITMPK